MLPPVFVFRGEKMNIAKVIERVRALKAGYDVSDEMIISYIDAAEQLILTDIVRGREGEQEIFADYGNYDVNSDREKELFARAPFDVVYEQYAATKIDLLSEESERYLNDMAAFRDTFLDLKRYWWQMHRQVRNYRFHGGV